MFSEEVIDRCLTSELWSHSCGHTMHTLSHCSRHFDNRQQHKPYGVHCACCEHIYDWGLKAGKWCRSVIWPVHSLEPPGSAYTHSNSHHATYTTVLLAKPFVPSVPHRHHLYVTGHIHTAHCQALHPHRHVLPPPSCQLLFCMIPFWLLRSLFHLHHSFLLWLLSTVWLPFLPPHSVPSSALLTPGQLCWTTLMTYSSPFRQPLSPSPATLPSRSSVTSCSPAYLYTHSSPSVASVNTTPSSCPPFYSSASLAGSAAVVHFLASPSQLTDA